MNEYNKIKKFPHKYREQTSDYQGEKNGGWARQVQEPQLLTYKIKCKDLLYSMGKHSQHFITTLNGVWFIKTLNHYTVYLKQT